MKLSRKTPEAEDSERPRLMIVDGGELVNEQLMQALTHAGFRIEVVANSSYVLTDTRGQRFDAIIMNGDFTEVNPLRLCLALRVQGCSSVITVIGKGPNVADELEAFRAGATERVEHTMPRDALVQRILAHIAGARIRVTGLLYPATAELPTKAGVFTMSLVPTLVTLNERPLSFTRTEERLFARLWAAQGAVVPRHELIASGWPGRKVGLPTLQVHLSQLRRKLSA